MNEPFYYLFAGGAKNGLKYWDQKPEEAEKHFNNVVKQRLLFT